MRLTTLIPTLAVLSGTLALPFTFPWSSNDNQNTEIPSLSVSDWQKIKSLGYSAVNSVEGSVKLADDYFKGIVNDLEEAFDEEEEKHFGWRTQSDDDQKTIWQLLNEDKERYSKVIKAVEIQNGTALKMLDNRDVSITFFAPENSGIPDPHRRHHDDDSSVLSDPFTTLESSFAHVLAEPSLGNILHLHERHHQSIFSYDKGGHDHDDDDDDKKKKEREKIFKFILGEILAYHGLPQSVAATELAGNSTVSSALFPKFGANDGEPLRIHVEKKLIPPSVELNFYAKVVVTHSDRKAINGYLHEIDHPLLPPPSILDEAFLSRKFDTFTTALQKVSGTGAVAWEFSGKLSKEKHHPVFVGNPAVTAFVPTREAFDKLPDKLQFFLFSPFGERVLAKVLSYHVVPDYVIFTESIHHKGHGHGGKKHHQHHEHEKKSWIMDEVMAELFDDNDIEFEREFPALLEGEKLRVKVEKGQVLPVPGATKHKLTVNGIQAEVIDVPALNGALHVLPEVLKPPHKDHDGEFVESSWEDWESWLPQWAESQ